MTENTYSVYVLIDPETAKVFYVGITNRPEYRMDQHLKSSHASTAATVDTLRERRKIPLMAILHSGKNKKWAMEREKELMFLMGAHLSNQRVNPWFGDKP